MAKQQADLATRLTPKYLGPAIDHMIDVKIPLFIWGPPGVGKSDIVRQVAESRGFDVIDVRLSQMEHSDIRGIPYLSQASNDEPTNTERLMKWAPPEFLPQDPNTKAILFLDELSSVSNGQTLAACYQLLLDRRVGNYKLPDGVVMVAAGNRISDRGVAFRLPSPIANRMVHVELVAQPDEWLVWAIDNQVHPDVVGYISFMKGSLATSFDASAPDLRGFPTPRSWVAVSKILYGMNPERPLDQNILRTLVAGAVGDGEMVRFVDYRRRAAMLPIPSHVLSGAIKEFESTEYKKDAGLCFTLTISIVYELEMLNDMRKEGKLSNEEFNSKVDNFFNFILNGYQPEVAVSAIRQIASRAAKFKLDVRTIPNFTKVRNKFANILHKQATLS